MTNTIMALVFTAYLAGAIIIWLLFKIAYRLSEVYDILNDGFTMLGDWIALYKSHIEQENKHGT